MVLQQPPQQRVLAHDLRVAARVAGGRHHAGELVDSRLAARVLELARLAQAVGDGQHVDRLALVVEREHRRVDRAVALAVEVLGAQALLDHERVQRAVRQQDRAEHRLLGLDVVRRGDHARGGARRRRWMSRPRSSRRASLGSPLAASRRAISQIATGKGRVAGHERMFAAARRRSRMARRRPSSAARGGYFLATTIVLIVAVHAVDDLDDDHVGADVLDRLLEVHAAFVEPQPARFADRRRRCPAR